MSPAQTSTPRLTATTAAPSCARQGSISPPAAPAPANERGALADRRFREARPGSSGGLPPAATAGTRPCEREGTRPALAGVTGHCSEKVGDVAQIADRQTADSPEPEDPGGGAARREGRSFKAGLWTRVLPLRRDEAALRGGGDQSAPAGLGLEEQRQGRPSGVDPLSADAQESAVASGRGRAGRPAPRLPARLHPQGQARDPLRGAWSERALPGASATGSAPQPRLGSVLGVREPPAPEPHRHPCSWVLGLS